LTAIKQRKNAERADLYESSPQSLLRNFTENTKFGLGFEHLAYLFFARNFAVKQKKTKAIRLSLPEYIIKDFVLL